MPQTPAVRKRRFIVSFHVDENELSFLNRQVAASSLNREEYLRTLIVGKEIHPRPCTHHADLRSFTSDETVIAMGVTYSRVAFMFAATELLSRLH
jgi:hypothetical protein